MLLVLATWRRGVVQPGLMTRVLLVPDLPLERWPSMDRYAHRLHDWLESTDPGFEVRLAASIGDLTRDRANGRTSGGYPRWWAQDVDPTKLVLPGPLHEPQRYVARYVLYPWWLRREAKRAQLVHILDHSYAHMVTRVQRRPAIVTVHDLMPVIILRSPTDGWREGVRNRFLRGQADAYLLQVGGRFSNDQQQLIERLGLRRFVRTVPLADESTLRRAYRAADVLLFPSLYEGFGYPVIEAFASGLPVVTSGAGGLKEVGGDASVVVEGRDPTAYVQALEALSDDPAHMELLIARGRVRAREFSWQKTAERTAEVYRKLL